jgi:hypothetical protein
MAATETLNEWDSGYIGSTVTMRCPDGCSEYQKYPEYATFYFDRCGELLYAGGVLYADGGIKCD